MIELRHLLDEIRLDRKLLNRPIIDHFNQFLLDTGEHVEHCVGHLDRGMTHFNLQVGLVVLALTMEFPTFLR